MGKKMHNVLIAVAEFCKHLAEPHTVTEQLHEKDLSFRYHIGQA